MLSSHWISPLLLHPSLSIVDCGADWEMAAASIGFVPPSTRPGIRVRNLASLGVSRSGFFSAERNSKRLRIRCCSAAVEDPVEGTSSSSLRNRLPRYHLGAEFCFIFFDFWRILVAVSCCIACGGCVFPPLQILKSCVGLCFLAFWPGVVSSPQAYSLKEQKEKTKDIVFLFFSYFLTLTSKTSERYLWAFI